MLLVASSTAVAAKKPMLPAIKPPTGAITLTADNAELVREGLSRLSGKVELTSNSLDMNADKADVRQFASGQFEATLTGAPATLVHRAVAADDVPVSAQATTLRYDTRSGLIELTGQARLTRDKDEVTGSSIRYNVKERRIQASGGEGGRVKIILQNLPTSSP